MLPQGCNHYDEICNFFEKQIELMLAELEQE